jgi:hypothetical protein
VARPLLTVALLGALGLVASACGDEPPSADEVAAIDSLVETELTVDEQRCILDGITRLEITASQILADELTAERDGELLATTLECVDDLATVEGFVDSFIAGAGEEGTELTRDEARCAIRALDTEDQGAAIRACLGDRAGDGAFGDDPVLDLLVEQCRRGNNQACDELHATSPIGSDYEAYGRTCGGRAPAGAEPSCFDELG